VTCRTRSSRSAGGRTRVARTWWRPAGGPVRRCAAPAAVAAADGVRRPTTWSTPPSGQGPRTATPAVRPCRRRNGPPTVRSPARHRRDDRSLRRPLSRTAAKCHCPGRVPTSCPSTSRSKSPTTVVRRRTICCAHYVRRNRFVSDLGLHTRILLLLL